MRLLLDECLPVPLRHHLVGHTVETVLYRGWKGIRNGRLLGLAAASGFDALITSDRAIEAEQNAVTIPLAIVIMHARSNKLEDILPLISELLKLLNHLPPRAFTHVHVP